MKFRKKFTKGLAISMAFSIIFSTNVFATPIDVANSEMDVKTDTLDKSTGTDYFADEENEWLDGTINEEVRVTVDLASQFEITIPKEIVLDGEDGTAQYKVKAVGDIAGDQKLSVVPDPDFVLSEAGGKNDVTATVTQADTEYVYTDLQGNGTEYDGSIAATLTAGEWSGKFNFNINFEGGQASEDEEDVKMEYSYDFMHYYDNTCYLKVQPDAVFNENVKYYHTSSFTEVDLTEENFKETITTKNIYVDIPLKEIYLYTTLGNKISFTDMALGNVELSEGEDLNMDKVDFSFMNTDYITQQDVYVSYVTYDEGRLSEEEIISLVTAPERIQKITGDVVLNNIPLTTVIGNDRLFYFIGTPVNK